MASNCARAANETWPKLMKQERRYQNELADKQDKIPDAEQALSPEAQSQRVRCSIHWPRRMAQHEKVGCNAMSESPCRYCIAPKRYPGCQSHCEHGIAYKSARDEQNRIERLEASYSISNMSKQAFKIHTKQTRKGNA